MSLIWAFDHLENNHPLYRKEGCMKKFCTSLRENAKTQLILKRRKCYH